MNYGQDISNELQNKTTVTLAEPAHTPTVLARHAIREQMICTGQANLQQARRAQQSILEAAVTAGFDSDAPMKLAILNNEITQGDYEQNKEVPIEMTNSEKMQYGNEWRSYREWNANLLKHRGQAFSLILGQCTQLLQDKMKQDTDWTMVSTSYDPLSLYRLIEKTILVQTEDQYPFATIYDQELAFYLFKQESLSNLQWYKRFNTKVDVGAAISVTRQHKVLLDYVAMELHNQAFTTLSAAEQQAVHEDTEEHYISYAFLQQSGTQHGNLKVDLQNDFTTGDNCYPKNQQQTLHLLDKYSKTVVPKTTPSEGTLFVQKGGKGKGAGRGTGAKKNKGKQKPFNKDYWEDKDCYKCGEKGHPAMHCSKKDKVKDDDDDTSRSSQAKSVKKLTKEMKSMKKAFTQLSKMKEAESDISDSDTSEGDSHFQFQVGAFQFTQVDNEFEPQIAKLFKQMHGTKIKLDLRQVILLDSQSTMDLICNPALVKKTFKSDKSMRRRHNDGDTQSKDGWVSCAVRQEGHHQYFSLVQCYQTISRHL